MGEEDGWLRAVKKIGRRRGKAASTV